MTHRVILTERQRTMLLALPTDEATMLKHYVLSDEDIKYIRRRRNEDNRLGICLTIMRLTLSVTLSEY